MNPDAFAQDAETIDEDITRRADPVDPTRLLGRSIGNHRLTALIGVGGMGAVYRAENLSLQRPAAVKSLQGNGGLGSTGMRRFLREARMLARLDHPNIVRIYDVARDAQGSYLIMEFVAGRDLELLRTTRKLSVHTCVKLLMQVARALAAAHGLGIVHRDVKPANILLSNSGQVKVTDFGLARPQEGSSSSSISQTGEVVGTPYYMAPEQAQGQEVDARADIYALGATAYALLGGQPPYQGNTPLSVIIQHVDPHIRPPRLRSLNPDVPAALEALVERMMAQHPEDRCASMADVVRALAASVRPPPAPRRRWQRWLPAAGLLACLLVGLLARPSQDARAFAALQEEIEAQPDELERAATQLKAFLYSYPDSRFASQAEQQRAKVESELEERATHQALRAIERRAQSAEDQEAWQTVIVELRDWLQAHPDNRGQRVAQRGLRHAEAQQAIIAEAALRTWLQQHPSKLEELEERVEALAGMTLSAGQRARLKHLRTNAHRQVLELRFGAFMEAFGARDGEQLVAMCDPRVLRSIDREEARKLLQGLFGLTSLLGWELETWQLVDCAIEAEPLSAQISLEMQLRHRDGHQQTESSQQSWRYLEGNWYLSPRG